MAPSMALSLPADQPRPYEIGRRTTALMWAGTAILLAGLLLVMTREPFEYVDDLAWLHRLGNQRLAEIPFSPAWMDGSPFYRPGAEIMLKLFHSAFGWHLLPYRIAQFGVFLLLIWTSSVAVKRLELPNSTLPLLTAFLIGSPFISGSVVWLSELPHVVVLICFAAGLAVIFSDRGDNAKLALCSGLFVVALSMKENGLALLVFYPFLAPSAPIRATLIFAAITLGYFVLRAATIGSGMGLANASPVDIHAYVVNIASQIVALWTRLTKWGEPIHELRYETPLILASTALMAFLLRKQRTRPVVMLLIVAFGCALFSYAYARDRHLALPAFAYGLLLVIAVSSRDLRWLVVVVWIAWSAQAALTIRDVHRASVDLIERVYRPNTSSITSVPKQVWETARSSALAIRD